MALERKTVVDQIEIRRDGTIQVRLAKVILDGDEVLAREYHRCTIEPGRKVEDVAGAVDANLGAGRPAADEWARVRQVVQLVHTPAVISEFVSIR